MRRLPSLACGMRKAEEIGTGSLEMLVSDSTREHMEPDMWGHWTSLSFVSLPRLVIVFPQAKNYFEHLTSFPSMLPLKITPDEGSWQEGDGVLRWSPETPVNWTTFPTLSELHCDKLHVDPENFRARAGDSAVSFPCSCVSGNSVSPTFSLTSPHFTT